MTYRTDPTLKVIRGDGGDYAAFTFTVSGDVSDRVFWLTGKRALTDTIPVFQASTARGDVDYVNAADGVIVIRLRSGDTAQIQAPTQLYCDLQVDGGPGTLDRFMLTVEMDVTEIYE